MTAICKGLLAAAITASLLLPATAFAKPAPRMHSAKITVHPKRWHWNGYGFLPGYRPSLAETNGLPVFGPDPRIKREFRYVDWYGNVRYGYGSPRFSGGRWNGGSFGPCWTQTPIGPMPNCGQ